MLAYERVVARQSTSLGVAVCVACALARATRVRDVHGMHVSRCWHEGLLDSAHTLLDSRNEPRNKHAHAPRQAQPQKTTPDCPSREEEKKKDNNNSKNRGTQNQQCLNNALAAAR